MSRGGAPAEMADDLGQRLAEPQPALGRAVVGWSRARRGRSRDRSGRRGLEPRGRRSRRPTGAGAAPRAAIAKSETRARGGRQREQGAGDRLVRRRDQGDAQAGGVAAQGVAGECRRAGVAETGRGGCGRGGRAHRTADAGKSRPSRSPCLLPACRAGGDPNASGPRSIVTTAFTGSVHEHRPRAQPADRGLCRRGAAARHEPPGGEPPHLLPGLPRQGGAAGGARRGAARRGERGRTRTRTA